MIPSIYKDLPNARILRYLITGVIKGMINRLLHNTEYE